MGGDEQRGPHTVLSPLSHVLTSSQTIQPTTTLQALVNLKRPSLRLSPLETQTSDDLTPGAESHDNHALEFEYDCDAPKCSIVVQVIVSSNEPNPHGNVSHSTRRITVYESVFEGGFGRLLKLEDGATVDLGRFEHIATRGAQAADADHLSPKVETDLITSQVAELPEVASQTNITSTLTSDHQDNARKRRFTALHFRRRSQNQSVSGPALAVLDNDAAATTEGGEREKDLPSEDGVRVVIHLMALDDFGKELSSVNRQSTYLHVVRLGSPVVGEDHRSWVVKVVKREATASISHFVDARIQLMVIIQIGPHTFHLHEIYGLSSASTQSTTPAVNPTTHTYPPTASAPAEEEPSSECLVCLSSPREVVLLPCRHLVACKECAINMVEFGAGGAIMHAEEPSTLIEPQPNDTAETPAVDGSGPVASATRPAEEDSSSPVAVPDNEEGNAESSANEPSQVAAQPAREEDLAASSASAPSSGPAIVVPHNPVESPAAPVPQNPRRKRRAKGWSCPVCRQRECSRISHLALLAPCFDHFGFSLQPTHLCCGSPPLHLRWMAARKESASRRRRSTTR